MEKILIVDDEERMRKLVRDFLVKNGYIVFEAGNGEDAINIFLQDNDISLIILDVMMPKMDGYTATKTIRALDSEIADIPILAITANAFDEDKRKALEVGMNGHIAKPIDMDRLIEAIFSVKGK